MSEDKSIRPDQMEQRSCTHAALLVAASSPVVAAGVHVGGQALVDKLKAPKETPPQVEIPAGQRRPEKD